VPFFDATNDSYWLLDKSLRPKPEPSLTATKDEKTTHTGEKKYDEDEKDHPDREIKDEPLVKKLSSITISGKVPLEKYTELFNYFITPFAMSGNKLDIEVKFRIKSTENSPLDETKQQYKNAKEAAKQLGLEFEEDQ
jgi:hypothetical protein